MKCISDQTGDQINSKVSGAAVPGMLALRDVFKLVVDRFDDEALAEQKSVGEWHKPGFHVFRGCFGIGSPVSPGCVVSLSKALGDKVATCEIDKGFARGGEGFIIFAEPAVVS